MSNLGVAFYIEKYKKGTTLQLHVDVFKGNAPQMKATIWYRCRSANRGVIAKSLIQNKMLHTLSDPVLFPLDYVGCYEVYLIVSRVPFAGRPVVHKLSFHSIE
jgi:hypothetical protein